MTCSSLRLLAWIRAAVLLLTISAFTVTHSDGAASDGAPVLMRTFHVAGSPQRLAVNPDTSRLYVTNFNGDLQIIDADSGAEVKTLQAISAWAVAVNRTTNRVYVAQWAKGQVAVVNGTTNSIIAEIDVVPHPTSLAVNPVSNRIYANSDGEKVSVIDGNTNEVIDEISVGASYIAVDSTTNTIYTTSLLQCTMPIPIQLSAIDGETNDKTAEVQIGPLPFDLQVDPANGMIIAVTAIDDGVGPGQLWMVDAKSFSVARSVPMNQQISAVGVNTITHEMYAVNFYPSTVAAFDSSGNELGRVEVGVVGAGPTAIAVDEIHDLAYVSVGNAGEIAVIGKGPASVSPSPRPSPGVVPIGGGPPAPREELPATLLLGALALMTFGASLVLAARRAH